ncbi:unnamed protein product [Cunninghamella blakesleeana]
MIESESILSILKKNKHIVLDTNYYSNCYQKVNRNNEKSQDQLVQEIYTDFLNNDLSETSQPVLQHGIQKNMVLQLKDTMDTTHSYYSLMNNLKKKVPLKRGTLKWLLTDGKYDLFVFAMAPTLDITLMTPFGSKFLIKDGVYANGILLVKPDDVIYLGGSIPTFDIKLMEKELIKRFEEKLNVVTTNQNPTTTNNMNSPVQSNQRNSLINSWNQTTRTSNTPTYNNNYNYNSNSNNNNSNTYNTIINNHSLSNSGLDDEFDDDDFTMEDINEIEQTETSKPLVPNVIELSDDEFYNDALDDYDLPSSQLSQKLEESELQFKRKKRATTNATVLSDTTYDDDDDFNEMTIDDDNDDDFYSIKPNKSSTIKNNIPNHSSSTSLINKSINNYDNPNSLLSTRKSTTHTIENSHDIGDDDDDESLLNDDLDLYIDDITIPSITTITELRKLMDDLENGFQIPKNKKLCKVMIKGCEIIDIKLDDGLFIVKLPHDQGHEPILALIPLKLFNRNIEDIEENPNSQAANNKFLRRTARGISKSNAEIYIDLSKLGYDPRHGNAARVIKYVSLIE